MGVLAATLFPHITMVKLGPIPNSIITQNYNNLKMWHHTLLNKVRTCKFVFLASRPLTLSVGSILTMQRKFSNADIEAFSLISQDRNPLHFDGHGSRFQKPVVHGMLVASMFSALVGNSVPGAVYLTQNLKWVHPVYEGDLIIAKVEVLKLKIFRESVIASMKTTCTNESSVVVLEGKALCQLPQRQGA